MKRLWPKVKITTIVGYLVILTVISVVANLFLQKDMSDEHVLTVEGIATIQTSEIKTIEISKGNVLYALPDNQFQKVLDTVGTLKPSNQFSLSKQSETTCTVQIDMKDGSRINLLVKKNDPHPEMAFIELQKIEKCSLSEIAYLAEDLCGRIIE